MKLTETYDVVAFADDVIVLIEGGSRAEIERKGQAVMSAIHEWADMVKLLISPSKSQVILFGPTLKRQPIIKSKDQTIQARSTAEYLGVLLLDY